MENKMDIQWYPGHMAKFRRMIEAHVAPVDVVVELLDARIPRSSKNPDIDGIARSKRRLILLNKADLADPAVTKEWEAYYRAAGFRTLAVNATDAKIAKRMADEVRDLMSDKIEREKKRGRIQVSIRAMVAGIPNVGKSTLINRLSGSAAAATGDRPGVTRGRQWIKAAKDFDVLDTPGVLWPKFEDKTVGLNLALTGAIRHEILDETSLAEILLERMMEMKPEAVYSRYKLAQGAAVTMEAVADARGYKIKGGAADIPRAAQALLEDFRGGKLGRMTLERVEV